MNTEPTLHYRSWACSRCGSRYPNKSCYVCDETPESADGDDIDSVSLDENA